MKMLEGDLVCDGCGKVLDGNYCMCDQEMGKEWCPECFDKTPCASGEHGEECQTNVFSDGKAEHETKSTFDVETDQRGAADGAAAAQGSEPA